MTTLRAAAQSAIRLSNVNWVTAGFMVVFHVLAVAAFWFFTWTNLVVALVLYWMAVGFGISMGYHRLHTHRGFKTSKAFEYFLAVCGTLTLEGGPIFWVATHRLHHQHSDHAGDPHSPRVSGFWAHIGWILFGDAHHNNTALMAQYAPDLARDPFYRWLNTYHWVPLTTLGLILLAVGGWPLVLLGHLPARRRRPARDLAGELGDAHVGQPPLRHARRFAQQLVGGAADVRRRLAQQPPRASRLGAPRPRLVRVRHHLDRAEAAARASGSSGTCKVAKVIRVETSPASEADDLPRSAESGHYRLSL